MTRNIANYIARVADNPRTKKFLDWRLRQNDFYNLGSRLVPGGKAERHPASGASWKMGRSICLTRRHTIHRLPQAGTSFVSSKQSTEQGHARHEPAR